MWEALRNCQTQPRKIKFSAIDACSRGLTLKSQSNGAGETVYQSMRIGVDIGDGATTHQRGFNPACGSFRGAARHPLGTRRDCLT